MLRARFKCRVHQISLTEQCVRTFQTNLSPSSRLLSFVTFWGKQHRKQFETLMKFVQSFFFKNCIWNDLPHKKKDEEKEENTSFICLRFSSLQNFIYICTLNTSQWREESGMCWGWKQTVGWHYVVSAKQIQYPHAVIGCSAMQKN